MEWEINAGIDNHVGGIAKLWNCGVSGHFQYFFECCIRQETNFSHLIKFSLKKHSKTYQVLKLMFLWALEQNILNKYNCSRHPANVKVTEWIGGQTKNY